MKSLLEVIQLSEAYLRKQGIERPRREAEWLIADILQLRRIDLYLQHERPLTEEELVQLRAAIQRRGAGEPTAYIAGKMQFAGLSLYIDRSVLIPRPETEILVEEISKILNKGPLEGKILWDLCCGSGCIGLALKKRFPTLRVVLSDISEKSLEIAQKNAHAAGLDVAFKTGDLFAPFEGLTTDFFVCNPPYLSHSEFDTLSPSVRDFEPKGALVAGSTGLEFYERIAHSLAKYLHSDGRGFMEIGTGQGEPLQRLFTSRGWSCRHTPDWAGHDRFFFLERERQISVSS